jgi:hypothetical protein
LNNQLKAVDASEVWVACLDDEVSVRGQSVRRCIKSVEIDVARGASEPCKRVNPLTTDAVIPDASPFRVDVRSKAKNCRWSAGESDLVLLNNWVFRSQGTCGAVVKVKRQGVVDYLV